MPLSRDTLNDYECMLATSTCNVGLVLQIGNDVDALRQAWRKCMAEYEFLACKLVATSEMGALGPRYKLEEVKNTEEQLSKLWIVSENSNETLIKQLRRVGTTSLQTAQGTYAIDCIVKSDYTFQLVISLCHSVSDGPGAVRVALRFVDILVAKDGIQTLPPQILLDMQVALIGEDYSNVPDNAKSSFDALKAYSLVLMHKSTERKILPPETMQNIPADDGFGELPMSIHVQSFTLTKDETEKLRAACRKHGGTIQGAISIASLLARVQVLDSVSLPLMASIQVPVNCRGLVEDDKKDIFESSCLCGSAGVVHMIELNPNDDIMANVAACTDALRAGIEMGQPKEWLHRLLTNPATLPSYSLMASSIGVVPNSSSSSSIVSDFKFFGGALDTCSPSKAQSTMVHALTFHGELTVMLNYTNPGVAHTFAEKCAAEIRSILLRMTML